MSATAKITRKGQITLPKEARKALGVNSVLIEIIGDEVRLKPVKSVAGSLKQYSRDKASLKEIRDIVWREAANEKK